VSSSSLNVPAAAVTPSGGPGDLLSALRAVPDPRPAGARRHPTAFVFGVLVMSMASGFESFTGAAQWAGAAGRGLLLDLGAVPDPLTGQVRAPREATIRRVATTVDREAFEAVVAAWTAAQLPAATPGAGRTAVALTARPCAVPATVTGGPRTCSPLAPPRPSDTVAAVVLAQRQIPGTTNEIPLVAELVTDLRAAGHDPATMIVTADALHTQHTTATVLHTAGAGYVLTVKGNQPGRSPPGSNGCGPTARAAPATVAAGTGAPRSASSRSPRPPGSPSPAPHRSSGSPATPADWTASVRAKRSCTASPTSPQPKPMTPDSPRSCAGTGPSRTTSTGSAT